MTVNLGRSNQSMANYKLAKLNDREHDLKKPWFVEYQFMHPETKEWTRFRTWISIRLKTSKARREKAEPIIKNLNKWLKAGGNPFSTENLRSKTVSDALNNILELKKFNCRVRTHHTYKHVIGLFNEFLVEHKMANLKLDEMNSAIAQDFLDWLKRVQKMQNRTHNYMRMHMSCFFNDLKRRNQIEDNPFQHTGKLQVEETSLVAFKADELNLVRTKLKEDDKILYCIAGLIFYCALRPAEIMRLKIGDLFLEEGLIHISGGQSKNKKVAWINVCSNDFLQDLKSMNWNAYPKDFFLFTRHLKPGEKEAAPTRIAERWREWANKNNISRNIYDLKHTAAGMAADNGVSMRDLQLHFRHSAIGITEKYLDRFRTLPGPGLIRYPSM